MKYIKLTSLLLVALIACSKPGVDEHAGHDHGEEAVSLTTWTDDYEFFAEFSPNEDHSQNALIHVTQLKDFKPLVDDHIAIIFESESDQVLFDQELELARPGIYSSAIELPETSEHYHVALRIGNEMFDLGHVAFDEHELEGLAESENGEHDHEHDAEANENNHNTDIKGEIVPFLKEQQWVADFNVYKSKVGDVRSVVYAIGQVIPHQQGLSEIVSPVEGYLNVNHNQNMVVVGARVKNGQILATLCPPIGRSNTWTERYLSFQRAEKNYQRAQELKKRQAISNTEFEQIEQDYLVEKAGFETLLNAYNITPDMNNKECMHFYVKAPIDGIVSEMNIKPGQNIGAGDQMMTLVDPDVVWIHADLYEKEYYRLGKPDGATLELPGRDEKLHLDKNEIKMINKGEIVEQETRTIPVLFQLQNKDRVLKIGQTLQMNIYSASDDKAVIVPVSAILDEDIQKFVFVQHSGESFEKRLVKTGPVYKDNIAILEGLNPNERIVTKGTYLLKLATVTTAVGHAHSH